MQGSVVIAGQHAEYSLTCDALRRMSLVAAEHPFCQGENTSTVCLCRSSLYSSDSQLQSDV